MYERSPTSLICKSSLDFATLRSDVTPYQAGQFYLAGHWVGNPEMVGLNLTMVKQNFPACCVVMLFCVETFLTVIC